MTTIETTLPERIDFYFDPACPWTWNTSRWLVDAASSTGVTVGWRTMTLAALNAGREIPPQYRGNVEAGKVASRALLSIVAAGDNDLAGRYYAALGQRWHQEGAGPSAESARELALAVAPAHAAAIDDESWDDAAKASTDEAMALAGPDVGSPILAFGTPRVGIFGPIVSPPPSGADAARLLAVAVAAATTAGFFELKRGRSAPIQFPPSV